MDADACRWVDIMLSVWGSYHLRALNFQESRISSHKVRREYVGVCKGEQKEITTRRGESMD